MKWPTASAHFSFHALVVKLLNRGARKTYGLISQEYYIEVEVETQAFFVSFQEQHQIELDADYYW